VKPIQVKFGSCARSFFLEVNPLKLEKVDHLLLYASAIPINYARESGDRV
jgi:hypothetical protein